MWSKVNKDFFKKYDSIDKLFEIIRSAIAKNAYRVDVKYHPTLGYPTQISIDYNKEIADEELFLNVDKLAPQSAMNPQLSGASDLRYRSIIEGLGF